MTRKIVSIFILMVCADSAFADTGSSSGRCQAVRTAQATVTVNRLYWIQEKGNYKYKTDTACKVKAVVPVLAGPVGGCVYPNLAKCPIRLDGRPHTINVSGSIYHSDDPHPQSKHFTAWYHVDRNSGSVTTGEAASSNISTQDLSLKKLTLEVQSKFDGPTPGKTTRDGVRIAIDYLDTELLDEDRTNAR